MQKKMLLNLRYSLLHFWKHYPALEFGMAFLIGMASNFHLGFLTLSFLFQKKIPFILILVGFSYYFLLYPHASLKEPTSGTGIFHVEQIKRHASPFKPLLIYQGTLKTFHTKTQTFHRLPCRLYMDKKKDRPLATKDYVLSDISVIETNPHQFILKTNKETTWYPLERTKSLAEYRFQIKEKIQMWVKKKFHSPSVSNLIYSLLTGQKENRLQNFQFGQIGLQHLLAISGFHFSILTLFLALLFRRFFKQKLMACLLIFTLSTYFLYMGDAPSISRAWIGVLSFLGGILLDRKSSPLNALGVGLLAALMTHPPIFLDIGFQLSFAATFGILLFYIPSEKKLQKIFPRRSFTILKKLPIPDQIGALFSTYLRKAISLNLAVLSFTLPILIFHFHKFPLISLFYNLFFPLLFSFLIGLLLFNLLFPVLFFAIENYASFLLWIITHAPKKLMFSLRFSQCPKEMICLILVSLFMWGAYLQWSSPVIKEWELT